ncbi:tRNA pseudouridine(55) synthase TruB [Mycolicibacterium sp. P9-22]|nr:tRNA pseudouridine(55) synthase TruB [Mycolicibacterium sp. P9-22]
MSPAGWGHHPRAGESAATRGSAQPVPAPGLVIVDKPGGMTSHDVVGRCRRLFGTRKVGHAGTLDPMATGVLVIGIERATKILGLITGTDKSYAATIRLGQTTSTEDAEGQVLQTVPAEQVTDEQIAAAVSALRGNIDQVPSAVSAIKVAGERSYKLAREGRAVELPARPVRIERFDVLAVRRHAGFVDVDVVVDCSSGTYIRALARDVGEALEVGGHLTALRRTAVGRYGLDEARTLDDLAERARLSYSLDEACLLGFPRRDLTESQVVDTGHGRSLEPAGISGVYAATAADGRVIALLEDGPSRTKPVVVLRPATL